MEHLGTSLHSLVYRFLSIAAFLAALPLLPRKHKTVCSLSPKCRAQVRGEQVRRARGSTNWMATRINSDIFLSLFGSGAASFVHTFIPGGCLLKGIHGEKNIRTKRFPSAANSEESENTAGENKSGRKDDIKKKRRKKIDEVK